MGITPFMKEKARQMVPVIRIFTSVWTSEIVHWEIQSSEQVFVTSNLVKIKKIEVLLE